jgi:pimeloyl-ACP methyl ester carboxylesterase
VNKSEFNQEINMMRLTNVILAGSIGVVTALTSASEAQSPQQVVKNIVLVHGAFADGTSWGKVIPILESRGFHVVAVQNPLTSLSDDANATMRIPISSQMPPKARFINAGKLVIGITVNCRSHPAQSDDCVELSNSNRSEP